MFKLSILAIIASSYSALVSAQSVYVGGALYQLTLNDFDAITQPYGNTTAVVAYEKTFDVEGDYGQTLLYQINGEIESKWYAGNMAASLSVTCRHYDGEQGEASLIGESLAFGVRYNQFSFTAKPRISEVHNTAGRCQKMTVRVDKVGHLSRQFFTLYEAMNVRIKILEVVGG